MRYLLMIGILFLQIACHSSAQQVEINVRQDKSERKPFQKSSVVLKAPTVYDKRETEKGVYDPRPKVVVIDEKAGKYELRWIGYDGKEKIVPYQRTDALDALVEARVEKTGEGKFAYKYLIKNLPGSPSYLSGFIVQTLSGDVKAVELEDVYIGKMANYIPQFKEGVWWRFAPMGETLPNIDAGKSIEFTIVSTALPGIVGCRASGGDFTLKGAGEHMPTELEAAMPGYDELASCSTIGPIDGLAKLSKSERVKYLSENLPKFQEAGWMSEGTAKIYEAILKRESLSDALEQAKKDLKNEFITSEVFSIIEGLAR